MLDASHAYYAQIMLACKSCIHTISTSLLGLLSAAIYVYIIMYYVHMHTYAFYGITTRTY